MSKLTAFFRSLMAEHRREEELRTSIAKVAESFAEGARKALWEKRAFVPRDDDPVVVVEAIDLQWRDDPMFRGPCVSFKLIAYKDDEVFERPNRSYVKVTSSCTEEQIDAKIERHMQGYREDIILELRERVEVAKAQVELLRAAENARAYVARKQSRTMVL